MYAPSTHTHTLRRTHTVCTSSFYSILESHLFVLFSLYFSIHSHSFILNHSLPQCECTYACQSPCKIALIIVHTICWVVLFSKMGWILFQCVCVYAFASPHSPVCFTFFETSKYVCLKALTIKHKRRKSQRRLFDKRMLLPWQRKKQYANNGINLFYRMGRCVSVCVCTTIIYPFLVIKC